MIDRAIGIAGLALAVISLVAMTLFPVINRKLAWSALTLGLVLLAGAGVIAFLPDGNAEPPSSVNGNCNNFGNNNVNCNTFSFAPTPRRLDRESASKIASAVRGSGISVLIIAPSDPEVRDYERDLAQALDADGIRVQPFNIGSMSPPPYGVVVRPNGHDAQRLLSALRDAGVTPTVEDAPLPVPGSIMDQFKQFVGLIIGFRDTR